jgi:hypothetical protein
MPISSSSPRFEWLWPNDIENNTAIVSSSVRSLMVLDYTCITGHYCNVPFTFPTPTSTTEYIFYVNDPLLDPPNREQYTIIQVNLIDTPFITGCNDPCADLATSTNPLDLDNFKCGVRESFCWLFNPPTSTVNIFDKGVEEIKGSFPFSLYFSIAEGVEEGLSSTTDSMAGTIGIPMYNAASSSFYILPVVSSTSLPALIGSTNSNNFRLTFVYLFWILGATYIIFRLIKR